MVNFAEHKKSVHGVAFSPDSRLLSSAAHDDNVYVWDAATGEKLYELRGRFTKDRPVHIAFSPDGRFLASGSVGNSVKVWDVRTGVEVQSLLGHENEIYSVALVAL